MSDGIPKNAGDPGTSKSPMKIRLANTPTPHIAFLNGDTVCFPGTMFPFADHLNNVKAVKHVYKYAIDTPMDDISTTHRRACRPNQGANMATTDAKIIPT